MSNTLKLKNSNFGNSLSELFIKRDKHKNSPYGFDTQEYLAHIALLKAKFLDLQYALFSELSFIEIGSDSEPYSEYYQQKRRIVEAIVQNFLKLNKNYTATIHLPCFTEPTKLNSVAILTYAIRNKKYSPGVVAVEYAIEFAKRGYKVAIFVEDPVPSLVLNRVNCKNLPLIFYDASSLNDNMIKKTEEEGVETKIYANLNVNDKIQQIIYDMSLFRPAYIIDMADECSIVPEYARRIGKVFNFPMQMGKGSCMSYSSYLCASVDLSKQINKKYKCFDEKKFEAFIPGVISFSESSNRYNRNDLNVSSEAFIIVTVGWRLDSDITEEMLSAMLSLLEKNRDFVWFLIGTINNAEIMAQMSRFVNERRIFLLQYIEYLSDFYRICDCYVNPDRKGGGTSILLAMHEGLPIAILSKPSDGSLFVGYENCVVGSFENMTKYIEKLYSDKELYQNVSNKMKIRSQKFSIPVAVDRLVTIMERDC